MKPSILVMALMLSFTWGSCNPSDDNGQRENPQQPDGNDGGNGTDTEEGMKMEITIGSELFKGTLADNETAREFRKMLPLTLDMSDYNNNEKVTSLGKNLPTSSSNPGTIRTGDLMLWGSNSIVLFYKTFSTSYSYTRLGWIDNPSGLETALGTGHVTVKFKLSGKD